jgi:beta-glucosidase-like glycosyl hydrolase
VETGAVSEAEIDAGTRRVLDLKARYGLLHDPSVRRSSPRGRSSAGP